MSAKLERFPQAKPVSVVLFFPPSGFSTKCKKSFFLINLEPFQVAFLCAAPADKFHTDQKTVLLSISHLATTTRAAIGEIPEA